MSATAPTNVIPVLYAGDDPLSKEAELELRKANLEFQLIIIKDPDAESVDVPQLLSPEGFFTSLSEICWYARVYGKKTKGKGIA